MSRHLMEVKALDHWVLTVRDIPTTLAFYAQVLGMEVVQFGEGRHALRFGQQKINLHQQGQEFEPKAHCPAPGSADFCVITERSLTDVMQHLDQCGVDLIAGPVERTGAIGPLTSVYFRDPDGNLIEVSNNVSPTECET